MAPCLKGFFLFALVCSANALGQTKYVPPLHQPGHVLCCTDASGQRACGDILPRQCNGRAYSIYNREGVRIRDIAAPIASEEKEQERQVAEIRERETRDQKRRETALLSTYASLEDIDKMQAQAESGLKKDIAEAEEKTADAQKRLQDLQETAKLYEGKTMPADLSSNLQNEEMQVKYQSELIRLKKRDLKEVQQKYATDKRRYKEITRQKNP